MQFEKIHALGNDFVVYGSPSRKTLPKKEYIAFLCSRHYGIGADCAIFVSKSDRYDYFMHVYNPDGFEAEICGNALRCAAKYVSDRGFFKKSSYIIETVSGPRHISKKGDYIKAEIGKGKIIDEGRLEINGVSLPYTFVSMGNPHCVIFTSSLTEDEFKHFGPAIEKHPLFPDGTNVEFVCISDNRMAMRVWERGIGETLSCSTGSCACVTAARHKGFVADKYHIYQPGGMIEVEVDSSETMFITSKCTTVFKGNL